MHMVELQVEKVVTGYFAYNCEFKWDLFFNYIFKTSGCTKDSYWFWHIKIHLILNYLGLSTLMINLSTSLFFFYLIVSNFFKTMWNNIGKSRLLFFKDFSLGISVLCHQISLQCPRKWPSLWVSCCQRGMVDHRNGHSRQSPLAG